MSDIKKNNPQENINIETFEDDDLWDRQSTKKDNNLKIDSEEIVEDLTINKPLDLIIDDTLISEELEEIGFINSDVENENIALLEVEKVNLVTTNSEELIIDSSLETDKDNLSLFQNISLEIDVLKKEKQVLIKEKQELAVNINLLVKEGLKELELKKENLELTIQKLERRKEKIDQEMKTTFSGVSQDLAIRVQGFKDYLVGSLQDLAAAAEQLELSNISSQSWENVTNAIPLSLENKNSNATPQFVEKNFQEENRQIRSLLNQYRTKPDYYGAPWQLRRTFESNHAERVAEWFFKQGGRGALRSLGTRLQNILVTSAIISVLYQLYGHRSRILILGDTPERLGEWRRGLQDCLGISRSDFGPNRGVILFETSESLIQKGDRIMEEKDIPFVIMDQTDDKVSLSLLKFPLWLAFAADQNNQSSNYYY